MTRPLKKALLVTAALGAMALGGSAIAMAASGTDPTTTGPSAAAATDSQPAGQRQRSPETELTGDTAAKVEAAALAKVGGGTVDRVEIDGDGNAAYEAHVTTTDGSRITVYVDEQFDVVGTEEGGPGAHARGDETPLTGDTAAKVTDAAIAKVGGTVERVETDAEGNAAYEAHVTRTDGSRVTVYVDEQFAVVGVEDHPSSPAGAPDAQGGADA